MTAQSKATIKSYFQTGDYPTQAQFEDLVDSYADTGSGGSITGPASSVDSQIALFNGTGGTVIKAATTTGILKATSGVIAAAGSGTDYAPPTSGTSFLKGNGSGGFSNQSTIALTDLATQAANTFVANASTSSAAPTAAVALSASQLAGRGSSGDLAAITLGTKLSMSTTTLNVATATTAQSTPSDPTGTSSTTQVMMGLAGSITPTTSGKVLFIISGDMQNSSGSGAAKCQIRYGTGTAPTNGAAATGATIGGEQRGAPLGAVGCGFSVQAIVTGLTPSTAYWIDLGLAAVTTGTASAKNISITAIEL